MYYIPHFNTNQRKFKVVYDAAHEFHGVFLNKLLAKGPIFMQILSSILLRFGKKYSLASDIENMFFQICMYQDDLKPQQPIDLLTGYLNLLDNDLLFSETTTTKDISTPTTFLKSGGRNGRTATCICYKEDQNGIAMNEISKG